MSMKARAEFQHFWLRCNIEIIMKHFSSHRYKSIHIHLRHHRCRVMYIRRSKIIDFIKEHVQFVCMFTAMYTCIYLFLINCCVKLSSRMMCSPSCEKRVPRIQFKNKWAIFKQRNHLVDSSIFRLHLICSSSIR